MEEEKSCSRLFGQDVGKESNEFEAKRSQDSNKSLSNKLSDSWIIFRVQGEVNCHLVFFLSLMLALFCFARAGVSLTIFLDFFLSLFPAIFALFWAKLRSCADTASLAVMCFRWVGTSSEQSRTFGFVELHNKISKENSNGTITITDGL